VAEGLTNREVARRLHLSPHTVNTHLRHMFSEAVGVDPRRACRHGGQTCVNHVIEGCLTHERKRILTEEAHRFREGTMRTIGFIAPLLPGKTETDRAAMISCWRGERREAYEASRRRLGITREAHYIQPTPTGDVAVVYWEADDMEAALTEWRVPTTRLIAVSVTTCARSTG
jgi:Bacterial regulatory proteins, luxR family